MFRKNSDMWGNVKMGRISRLMLAIGTILALSIDYAAIYVLAFIWNLDILYYMLIILVLSLLFGAVVVDLKKTIIYMSVALLFGTFISVGVLSVPSLSLGEGETITLILAYISRYFLLSLFPSIPGIILGCFVGDAILSKIEFGPPSS